MPDVHWIKVLTDIFEDEKIRLIQSMPDGDAVTVIWFKLLTQAGKSNMGGFIGFNETMPYDMNMLSVIFNKPPQIIEHALDKFAKFGMIEMTDKGFIYIVNWEKHQSLDKLDKIREQARLRKQNERERKKALPQGMPNVTQSHADVTHGHATDIDIELDTEKEKDKNNKNIVDANTSTKRFIKPTLQQVFEYCQERKNNVDPEKWYDYYESNGWKVGKNSMKDWKAAVRTWEKNSTTSLSTNQRNYSKAEKNNDLLDRRFFGNDGKRNVVVVENDLFCISDGRNDEREN